ncbi:MAG: VWA domain-containing protein [Planctomycetota bacterium]|nr:VWA domain-containing protein [Planctomycetota bacterium]
MPTLAAIAFASPLMLLGLLALAAPLLAHLLRAKPTRPIVFPTLALLARASAPLRRERRWHDRALLACRCLAMAAIALAFARPTWNDVDRDAHAAPSRPMASDGSQDVTLVVLLIDDSASTGQRMGANSSGSGGDVELIASLRSLAKEALASLRPGLDRAFVIATAGRARALLPEPTTNLAALDEKLGQLVARPLGNDLPGSFALAAQAFAGRTGPRRLVIVSDLQRSDWASIRLPPELAGAGITIVPPPHDSPSSAPPTNAALAFPCIAPARPIAGESAEFVVDARHFGPKPLTLDISATLDGQPLPPQRAPLAGLPDSAIPASITVRFILPPLSPGPHELVATIPDDALSGDNTVYLPINVQNRRPAVLLSDEDPDQPRNSTFYLVRAIQPLGPDQGRVDLRLRRPTDLAAKDLVDVPAVILGPVDHLGPIAADLLSRHLDRSGRIALLAGAGHADRHLRELFAARSWPATITLAPRSSDTPIHLAPPPATHPLLAGFDGPARLALAAIPLRPAWTIAPARQPATDAIPFDDGTPGLLRLDDSPPALLRLDDSPKLDSIWLVNLGPLDARDDLVRHALFPALVRNLLNALEPASDAASRLSTHIPLGSPLHLSLPGNSAVMPALTLVTPDGARHAVEPTWRRDHWDVTTTADRAGFHRLYHGERLVASAAGEFPPGESDLRAMPAAELARQLSAPNPSVASGSDVLSPDTSTTHPSQDVRVSDARTAAGPPQPPTPLWPALIALAMAALAGEAVLTGARKP